MTRTVRLPVDFHVHAGPSLWPRKHDAVELAKRYAEEEFGGFVLKSHFGLTFPAGGLAAARTPGVDVYGAVALNTFVGGFNPDAVTLAAETGCSVVWLPTFSAANFETDRCFPFERTAMTVTDGDGDVKPAVRDVLACIDDASRRLVLGNGHLSPHETRAMLDAIDEMGVDTTLLVTHADSAFMRLSTADQVKLAARGAVVEKCLLPAEKGDVTVSEAAESINRIGAEHCVLSTDFGQPSNASPPTAYRSFVASLREHGVSARDLKLMCRENPVALLGEPLPDDAC